MPTYLEFSIEGDITQLKTKDKSIEINNYDYTFIDNITYMKHNFVILYNRLNKEEPNVTKLPFYEKTINGKFVLFLLDNFGKIKSLKEEKFLKLINIEKNYDNDYSSDDFNLSD